MPNREEVIRILRDQTLGVKFNFYAPSGIYVTVDRSTFANVADAIESGRISLDFDQSHLPKDGDAMYIQANLIPEWYEMADPISGIMLLNTNNDFSSRGAVVHESVHASLDLSFTPNLMALENEAAAFIAEALYYRNNNYRYTSANTPQGRIVEESRRIANSISNANERQIPTQSVQTLIDVLMESPSYYSRRNNRYISNR